MADLFRTAAPIAGLALIAAGLLGLVLGGTGWLSRPAQDGQVAATATDVPVTDVAATDVVANPLPALDAAAPNQIETATFALG